MKWLQFILSHSIFISLCALALCYQTFLLLHIPSSNYIYGFVFFATLGSYNFYWLISKYYFNQQIPLIPFLKNNFSNVILFLLAAGGLLYFMLHLSEIFPYIIIAVLLTLVYSMPLWPFRILNVKGKVGFFKTVLLALTWAFVTVIIPIRHASLLIDLPVILLFSARFLFMLMLCIIFDSRDILIDKMNALQSLATDVSRHSLSIIMAVVFSLYMLTGFILRFYFDNMHQVIAFIITGMVTLLVYRLSLKKRGYFFYYFFVDGLMLFSAIATYVASI